MYRSPTIAWELVFIDLRHIPRKSCAKIWIIHDKIKEDRIFFCYLVSFNRNHALQAAQLSVKHASHPKRGS